MEKCDYCMDYLDLEGFVKCVVCNTLFCPDCADLRINEKGICCTCEHDITDNNLF